MWTEETLKKAAEEYVNIVYKHRDIRFQQRAVDIFLAGARYVINNTQN